jgi:hypothetical protein
MPPASLIPPGNPGFFIQVESTFEAHGQILFSILPWPMPAQNTFKRYSTKRTSSSASGETPQPAQEIPEFFADYLENRSQ